MIPVLYPGTWYVVSKWCDRLFVTLPFPVNGAYSLTRMACGRPEEF